MDSAKQKIFKDPVHGYISVPKKICKLFIDTAIFQRLRNIEQTSMGCLYPSASHNRFTHSLGVFFLAKTAFHNIKESNYENLGFTQDDFENILRSVKLAFFVAALMHDCGHSPFSHTLEKHYQRSDNAKTFLLKQVKKEKIGCNKFKIDYENMTSSPAAHEIFSAAIFLKHYSKELKDKYPSSEEVPLLVVRMITGCIHKDSRDNKNEQIENSFINLINGKAIDMDKLDYILRDTWSSGANNVMVDVYRLLSALKLDLDQEGIIRPTFNKSALSVIKSVIDGRNFLHYWIFSHHTVYYYTHILKNALIKLGKQLSPKDDKDKFMDTLFSQAPFAKPVDLGNGVSLYLPTDGDIYYLFKKENKKIPEVKEILTREPRLIPLWKTYAEFKCIFKNIFKSCESDERQVVLGKFKQNEYINNLLKGVISNAAQRKSVLYLPVQPNIFTISENELYVSLRNEVLSYHEVDIHIGKELHETTGKNKENLEYFFVFIPKEVSDKAEECIESLKKEAEKILKQQ